MNDNELSMHKSIDRVLKNQAIIDTKLDIILSKLEIEHENHQRQFDNLKQTRENMDCIKEMFELLTGKTYDELRDPDYGLKDYS